MKKNSTTTLLSVVVYILKSNYLLFTYLFVPILINDYKNTAYLAPIISFVGIFILVLILPKQYGEIDYNGIMKKSFIVKTVFGLVQAISMVLNILITTYTIGRVFFYENNINIFLLVTIGVVLFASASDSSTILNSSTFLLIASALLVVIPIFLTNDVKDYTLLKPFLVHKDYSFILLLYFGLDAITFNVSGAKLIKGKLTKWHLLIPLSMLFFLMSLQIINIILVTGTTFLVDNEFLGFFSLFIQDTINYIGNLGLLFLLVIPIVGIYKSAYSLRQIKEAFNIKNGVISNIIIYAILAFSLFLALNFLNINSLSYLLTFISIICFSVLYLFINLNRSKNYEIRF